MATVSQRKVPTGVKARCFPPWCKILCWWMGRLILRNGPRSPEQIDLYSNPSFTTCESDELGRLFGLSDYKSINRTTALDWVSLRAQPKIRTWVQVFLWQISPGSNNEAVRWSNKEGGGGSSPVVPWPPEKNADVSLNRSSGRREPGAFVHGCSVRFAEGCPGVLSPHSRLILHCCVDQTVTSATVTSARWEAVCWGGR